MKVPRTNNELLQLLKTENAIQNMVLQEVSDIKERGGNGEAVLPSRAIIKGILEREAMINRLAEAERQIKDKVYHSGWFTKFIWSLKRQLRGFLRKVI